MRRNKLLLAVSVILVIVMAMSLFAGCQTDDPVGNTEVNGDGGSKGDVVIDNGGSGTSADGKSVIVNGVDAFASFEVKAGDSSDIVVTDLSTGKRIQGVTVSAALDQAGIFIVNPPEGGWADGVNIRITLYDGGRFVDYPEASELRFTVARPDVYDVQMSGDFKTFTASSNITVTETNTDNEGNTYGSVVFRNVTGGFGGFEEGEIFLIEQADGTQAAYKALSDASVINNMVSVNYVKPDFSEVFSEFNYKETTALSNDSEIQFAEDIAAQLENSELNMAAITIFGADPTFDVAVDMVDGKIVAKVTVTIPDVLTIEGGFKSDLVLTIENVMGVEVTADIDKNTISERFYIYADITNDITTTVSLNANADLSRIENVQDLFDKLTALANDSEENPTSVKLFKWTLPIANGVASITYDADLVFAFKFAGSLDVEATANLDYQVGVNYTPEDGIQAYSNERADNGFDYVGISLDGMAEVKLGVKQAVGFDILAGVLSIGIEAEIGNYNRIYGYGVTTNLVNEEPDAFNGGWYFEGGFYYDVDLAYGLKVGSLLNLDDKADIAAGEVKLYEAGDRYVTVGISQSADEVELTSRESLVPAIYNTIEYDLVTGTESEQAIDASELTFTDESGNLTFEEGNVTANADEFEVAVTVSYEDFDSLTTVYSFTTAKPMLDKNYSAVVKSADANAATVTVGITYAGFAEGADVTVDGLDAAAYDVTVAGDTATVTLEGKELLKLDAGVYDLTFTVDGYALGYKLDISGTVSLYDFKISEGVYELFTADQVRQLSATAGSFENVTFVMTSDIDLGGSVIAPISNFKGVLDGSGYTISGYTIESMVGNNAAFIAVNDGTVRNLVLDGSVNVSFAGKTGNDYAIAGLAAVNNGTVTDVTVKGSVKAASTSLSAFIDIDAALVVAIDNSDATVADGEGSVAVTVSFDLVNVTVRVGALDSTTADDGVTMSVDCINGRTNPIFTNDIIAG